MAAGGMRSKRAKVAPRRSSPVEANPGPPPQPTYQCQRPLHRVAKPPLLAPKGHAATPEYLLVGMQAPPPPPPGPLCFSCLQTFSPSTGPWASSCSAAAPVSPPHSEMPGPALHRRPGDLKPRGPVSPFRHLPPPLEQFSKVTSKLGRLPVLEMYAIY